MAAPAPHTATSARSAALALEQRTSSGYYLDSLNGVRALAVMWVFVYHAWAVAGVPHMPLAWRVLGMGNWGVDLFLVLSGFLMTLSVGQWWDKPQPLQAVGRFYRRRILRIAPAYFFLLFCLVLMAPFGALAQLPTTDYLLGHFLFLPWWWDKPLLKGVLWSLPVEMTFYIFAPWMVMLFVRWRNALWTPLAALALFMLGTLAFRWQVVAHAYAIGDAWLVPWLNAFAGRANQFALGIFACVLYLRHQASDRPRSDIWMLAGLLLLGLCALAVAPHRLIDDLRHPVNQWGPTVAALACAVLVYGAAVGGPLTRRLLANRVMVWLGVWAYGIYLWHTVFMDALVQHAPELFGHQGGWRFIVVAALTLGPTLLAAALTYWLVERPFLGIRHDAREGASDLLPGLRTHPLGWLAAFAGLTALLNTLLRLLLPALAGP